MRYRILPAAQDDIEAIDAWVSANFGEMAAITTLKGIYETFDLLARFPEMGRKRVAAGPREARFFSHPPNWIVYVPGKPLEIHRVFPAKMDILTIRLKQR